MFSHFFAAFPESKENLKYFKKKMSLTGELFLKL